MKNKILRYVYIIAGALITLNGIAVAFTSNMNAGTVVTLMVGSVLMLIGLLFGKVSLFPRWIKAVFYTGLAAVIAFSSFLLIYGVTDTASGNEDALIVLGAGVHGKKLSVALRGRLDTALEYSKENPRAVIVVSGGQGPQEDISEASAMKKYLLEKGIPEDKVICEDTSTSTTENFRNSKALLDELFPGGFKAAFVTNEYHIFRAERVARAAGFEKIAHVHYSTRAISVIPSLLRECLAVAKYTLSGGMR